MFEGDAKGMDVWDGSESHSSQAAVLNLKTAVVMVVCGGEFGGVSRLRKSVCVVWFSVSRRCRYRFASVMIRIDARILRL